ncbi:Ribosomal protein L28e [Penicillium expansum]|uniref:Ribosomal protein L28e n=1 Tax=Penicillium expansum TaxID=27334 RepID=A0A0A2L161_PENEN|nr:Ribosomal protein L28e [Penicillium expansum]KGO37583.1 Ribosomal protein L28e [Penicillium expansum]KGO59236.1 Ribosomal protein L28e [Penicillium expansum]KGO70340.1 Ribosomal protein L28e [Penicillium expansum]
MASNISNDLVWQITRNQNSFLVNRNSGGGFQFSRDPLNLLNKHSYKAVGVQATENGVAVTTKKPSNPQQPGQNLVTVTYGPSTSTRKIYKGVADKTAKNSYRADLREEAVARVSAVRRSQLPKKDAPAQKLRGSKARKAEESE